MKTLDLSADRGIPAANSASAVSFIALALIRLPISAIGAVRDAYARDRDRAVLADLDDHILRDIGLTRAQVGQRPTYSHTQLW